MKRVFHYARVPLFFVSIIDSCQFDTMMHFEIIKKFDFVSNHSRLKIFLSGETWQKLLFQMCG